MVCPNRTRFLYYLKALETIKCCNYVFGKFFCRLLRTCWCTSPTCTLSVRPLVHVHVGVSSHALQQVHTSVGPCCTASLCVRPCFLSVQYVGRYFTVNLCIGQHFTVHEHASLSVRPCFTVCLYVVCILQRVCSSLTVNSQRVLHKSIC